MKIGYAKLLETAKELAKKDLEERESIGGSFMLRSDARNYFEGRRNEHFKHLSNELKAKTKPLKSEKSPIVVDKEVKKNDLLNNTTKFERELNAIIKKINEKEFTSADCPELIDFLKKRSGNVYISQDDIEEVKAICFLLKKKEIRDTGGSENISEGECDDKNVDIIIIRKILNELKHSSILGHRYDSVGTATDFEISNRIKFRDHLYQKILEILGRFPAMKAYAHSMPTSPTSRDQANVESKGGGTKQDSTTKKAFIKSFLYNPWIMGIGIAVIGGLLVLSLWQIFQEPGGQNTDLGVVSTTTLNLKVGEESDTESLDQSTKPDSVSTPSFSESLGPALDIVDTSEISVDFIISNSGEGVIYVDKIELTSNNFTQLQDCKKEYPLHSPLPIYSFDTIFMGIESKTYALDKYKSSDVIVAEYVGSVSDGLKYGVGDTDKFRASFVLGEGWFEHIDQSYSFNIKVTAYWCELGNCSDRKILESREVEVRQLTPC